MARRGAAQLEAIATVLDTLGEYLRSSRPQGALRDEAAQIVVFGSCALALYARPDGRSAIRTTRDVDVVSVVTPLALLQSRLAAMCQAGVLVPHHEILCRYTIRRTGTVVDVVDLQGRTTGAADPWLERAVKHSGVYPLGEGVEVRAVTPPFFLATKLTAFIERGPDEMSADAEDIVTLAVEVQDLAAQVSLAGIADEVRELWGRARERFDLSTVSDLVDYHIHPLEVEHLDRVRETLTGLAGER